MFRPSDKFGMGTACEDEFDKWDGLLKAKYAKGDRLYVREAHYLTDDGHNECAVYATDTADVKSHLEHIEHATNISDEGIKWHTKLRPSIHMPRWASRITSIGKSQVHITPRHILAPLGAFDLDPCARYPCPLNCARECFTEPDDGLSQNWFGRVWLNPPYHRYQINHWLEKMAAHGHGIALTHARTDTAWFFNNIWANASALLFLRGRVIFHKPDGTRQTTKKGKVANSGAPVVLAAYGIQDMEVLGDCGLEGQFVATQATQGAGSGVYLIFFKVK